tara:strand:+ start:109 stop:213 length:105 start_codon:yes stop_codon:yes gene_type:complete
MEGEGIPAGMPLLDEAQAIVKEGEGDGRWKVGSI